MSLRKRVALLVRPGAARERTEAALAAANAELAIVLDPTTASEAEVRGVVPDAVLVVLDPVVEGVLDKFDDILADSAFEVMFEDAEVAAKREGWEAARWARHLGAKLYGHGDVLPPSGGAAESGGAAAAQSAAQDDAFRKEMEALQLQVAAMPDVPPPRAAAARRSGAVVVAAGLGGPDAVRQVLGGLPAGFARPVVLRQRIDGGQYDKLVRQMQRATQMQVVLAQPGDALQAGTVYVQPDELGIQSAPVGLVFAAATEAANPFAALPADDSAVLLLSGADQGLVDAAMALSWAGGLAMGQSPEGCFDPTASDALVARGGQAWSLAQLPQKLLQRWPA